MSDWDTLVFMLLLTSSHTLNFTIFCLTVQRQAYELSTGFGVKFTHLIIHVSNKFCYSIKIHWNLYDMLAITLPMLSFSDWLSGGNIRLPIMSKSIISLFQFKCWVPLLISVFLARGRSSLSLGRLMAVKMSHLRPHLNWI